MILLNAQDFDFQYHLKKLVSSEMSMKIDDGYFAVIKPKVVGNSFLRMDSH